MSFNAAAADKPGFAHHSLVSGGSVVTGAVTDSILGRRVNVHPGAIVEECIILDNCHVGPGAHIRRTIIDKNAHVAAGERIGFDAGVDRQRFHVSDGGVTVVPGKRSPVELSLIGI